MCTRARHLIITVGTLLLASALQAPAYAGTWCAPVGDCSPILGFGEQYAASTHRGMDLAASPGSQVSAPVGGTVVFAGRVPADGGGTCGAVTMELPDGLRVSLLPLETVVVAAGDSVAGGDTLGVLASSGDDSSAAAHLHLGVRRGDVYIDPAGYLPTAVPGAQIPDASAGPVGVSPGSEGVAAAGGTAPSSAWSTPAGCDVADENEIDLAATAPVGDFEAATSPAAAPTRMGGSVLDDAGLPVPSALDPHRPRAYVHGAGGLAALPASAPFGAVMLLAAGAVALGLLVPWRVALARAE